MGKVLGIGGVFMKSGDPGTTTEWYRRVLRLDADPNWGGVIFPPLPQGYTIWSLFPQETTYFQPSTEAYMVNFLVDDLDSLVEHIRSEGVEVLLPVEEDPQGKFAWVVDPDGRKIELWQPNSEETPSEEGEASA